MKLEEVQFKLLAEIQSLPPELALEFINQSLKDIYKEHNWSFLYKRDLLRVPAMINTGTVAVEEFSTTVVPSSDLKAILDAITVNDVKLEGRQFRTFGGQFAGSNFIYTITSYDSTGAGLLTIDPYYQDGDDAAAQFQIFKNLYTASELDIDFAYFDTIVAPFAQRRLGLELTREELDKRDAFRISMGDPYYAVSYGIDSNNNQLVELYPIPVNKRTYKTKYRRKGIPLEPDDEIPSTLSYELILAKAKVKAYEWLIINSEKVGDKRSPSVFMNLIAMISNPNMENSYAKKLQEAKLEDENLYPQALIAMGNEFPFYENVVVETVLLDF